MLSDSRGFEVGIYLGSLWISIEDYQVRIGNIIQIDNKELEVWKCLYFFLYLGLREIFSVVGIMVSMFCF